MKRSVSHEFQHCLHNVNKYLRPLTAGQNVVNDDARVDEGCSMLAQDLAGDGIVTDTPRFSYAYLANPYEYSLTSFTGFNPNPLATGAIFPMRSIAIQRETTAPRISSCATSTIGSGRARSRDCTQP